MADTIGKFLQPKNHSDTVDPKAVQPAPVLSRPAPVPFEPAPALTSPAPIGPIQPAPPITRPEPVPFEPAPPLSSPKEVPFEPAPALTSPSPIGPLQPPPTLSVPSALPAMPPPPLSTPTPLPAMPAPPLTAPGAIPFQPPPVLSQPGPEAPIVGFSEPVPHQILVEREEARHNTVPGVIDDLLKEAANAAMSVAGRATAGVPVPGLGLVPLDVEVSPHGVKADIHLLDVAKRTVDRAITFAQAKASAAASAGVASLINRAGMPLISVDGQRPQQFPAPLDENYHQPLEGTGSEPAQAADLEANTLDSAHPAGEWGKAAADLRYLNDPGADTPDQKHARLKNIFNDQIALVPLDTLTRPFLTQSVGLFASTGRPETRGFFAVTGSDQSAYEHSTPSDDDAYVPLVFTDLRPLRGGVYRAVYFQPFITGLSEGYAPEWNMAGYFGRVDKVATYQATDRTITLSFKMVCFAPEDLRTMYQKLGWLSSMVYPMYDRGLRYFAGPVVKMRVGDLINAVGRDGNRGVPGVITALDYNYDEAPWELQQGRRMPKNVDVSLTLHVLHEYPIGSMKGAGSGSGDNLFGGIDIRNNGQLGSDTARVNVGRFRASFGNTDYLNDPNITPETPPSGSATE